MWNQLLQLSFRGKIGLQAQIREMLVAAILDGQLPAGVALPSTRELAASLGVSRNTVALVYELLASEGYLLTKSRSGHYVNPEIIVGAAGLPPQPRGEDLPEPVAWSARYRSGVSAQRNIVRPRDWQRYPYPFLYGQLDPILQPVPGWRECSLQATSSSEIRSWAGDLSDSDDGLLIEQIQTRLLVRRGIFASPEEILVTVGAQHALFLLATLLIDTATTVGIENPGYPGARNIFAFRTSNVVPLPLDKDGLAITPALARCDYVYLTPSHQCPTNITMPMSRREALLAWARTNDRVLIEDDYEIELGLEGRAHPALRSLDRSGRVVYVSSLSKTLAPGIRIGFIVGDRHLIRELRALRALMLRHPAANNERSVGLFLAMGHHDALLRRLRRSYAERSQLMAAALAAHLPEVSFVTACGASSYWVRFPEDIDARDLARTAARMGVLIEPGDVFFESPDGATVPLNYARLGLSSIDAGRIQPGIACLASAMAALRGERSIASPE
jgi:GntR family transcriptional regulator / MocR family aminotransferase